MRVSQPTFSTQIAALETALGERFSQQTGRNLALTEEGHQSLTYAEEIFAPDEELLMSMTSQPQLALEERSRG